jgi:ubiquitin carboxyl-terminal hydrolase 7
MKFFLVTATPFKQPNAIEDGKCSLLSFISDAYDVHALDDVLYEHKWANEDYLGLDHIDKTTKRSGAEKAVFIK